MKRIILDKKEYDLLVKRSDATLKEIEDTIDMGVQSRMNKWNDRVIELENELTKREGEIKELNITMKSNEKITKSTVDFCKQLSEKKEKIENNNFYLSCTIFALLILLAIMLINYI